MEALEAAAKRERAGVFWGTDAGSGGGGGTSDSESSSGVRDSGIA